MCKSLDPALLLLLLLSHFSHVWLCATPQMAAHQAPPSLGFSRQEHWSGLPFPSPMDPTLPHHKYSISLLLVWAKSLFPVFYCKRSRNSAEKHFYRLTPPQQPANQPTEDQKQLWKPKPVLPNHEIPYGLGLSICLFFNPFS